MMNIADLEAKTREELLELAEQMNVEGFKGLKKNELIEILIRTQAEQQGFMFLSGILDIMDEGYGFLRQQTLLPSAARCDEQAAPAREDRSAAKRKPTPGHHRRD